jgi:predicted DNA-binding transcriptional regulator AlpA
MADVPASDLINSQEIADWLGIKRRSVSQLLARRKVTGFPEPIIREDRLHLWSRSQVKEWAVRDGRLPES